MCWLPWGSSTILLHSRQERTDKNGEIQSENCTFAVSAILEWHLSSTSYAEFLDSEIQLDAKWNYHIGSVMGAAGNFPGILLDRKQPNIEGPLGEPDERDGDHRQ